MLKDLETANNTEPYALFEIDPIIGIIADDVIATRGQLGDECPIATTVVEPWARGRERCNRLHQPKQCCVPPRSTTVHTFAKGNVTVRFFMPVRINHMQRSAYRATCIHGEITSSHLRVELGSREFVTKRTSDLAYCYFGFSHSISVPLCSKLELCKARHVAKVVGRTRPGPGVFVGMPVEVCGNTSKSALYRGVVYFSSASTQDRRDNIRGNGTVGVFNPDLHVGAIVDERVPVNPVAREALDRIVHFKDLRHCPSDRIMVGAHRFGKERST